MRHYSLQRRLTITYTWVAVLGIVVVQLIGLLVAFPLLLRSSVTLDGLADGLTALAPQLQADLAAAPPDRVAAERWLAEQNFAQQTWPFPSLVRVTDAGGRPLASSGATLNAPILIEGTLLTNALTNADPAQLALRNANRLAAAAPVLDANGRVIGALLIEIDAAPQAAFVGMLLSLLPTALLATLGFGLIGTIAGYFVARGLVRRIDRVAAVAHAWGDGDLSQRIDDTSRDELGRLSSDLNNVAGRLRALLAERERLAGAEERNRIARDLHDSVKQEAFVVSMQLGAAEALLERDPTAARARLSDAAAGVGRVTRELQGVIAALRPPDLEAGDLAAALRDYGAVWAERNPITLHLHLPEATTLAPAIAEAVFRISQEALANVARHSAAATASLSLELHTDHLLLTICDDGRGFAVASRSSGFGLESMRGRARGIGGELLVQSTPGATQVRCRVPLERNEHE